MRNDRFDTTATQLFAQPITIVATIHDHRSGCEYAPASPSLAQLMWLGVGEPARTRLGGMTVCRQRFFTMSRHNPSFANAIRAANIVI
jgi:hypothetical protein